MQSKYLVVKISNNKEVLLPHRFSSINEAKEFIAKKLESSNDEYLIKEVYFKIESSQAW